MEIFPDHAVYNGKVITLYEAACILARAMQKIYTPILDNDGYLYEDVTYGVERFGFDAWVHGEVSKED